MLVLTGDLFDKKNAKMLRAAPTIFTVPMSIPAFSKLSIPLKTVLFFKNPIQLTFPVSIRQYGYLSFSLSYPAIHPGGGTYSNLKVPADSSNLPR